jgi:succinylglutamic semialdehyde dehydrogenase
MSVQNLKKETKLSKGNLIAGDWQLGKGCAFVSINPADEEVIWEGNEATQEEVNECIEYSRSAFHKWVMLSFDKRAEYVLRFQELLKRDLEEVAHLISKETGKTLWEGRAEASVMVGKGSVALESYSERCPQREFSVGEAQFVTRHRPHGVIVVMSPYNFPGHLAHGHIAPALLAGNVVVLKPSELTPFVAEKIVELWVEAGIPQGVIQLLQGGKDTGKSLTTHKDIDGVFFTGSSKTGLMLSELFGKHPEKILALEMGGNNPLIVSNVKDMEAAAIIAIQSAFITSGQRCTCCRRLFVLKDVVESGFLNLLKEKTKNMSIGDYMQQPEAFMGPLISKEQVELLLKRQEELIDLGGREVLRMKKLDRKGAFISPGIIDMTNAESPADEESFGPLLQVWEVDSLEEAITLANDTRYGLSAGIISDSKEDYEEYFQKSRSGILNWNQPTTGASGKAPFGGIGISGNHRPTGYYAADYCAYPIVSAEINTCKLPSKPIPGLS